jgi:hypothetical protein
MKILMRISVLLILVLSQVSVNAQCAMCKATAESNPNVGGGLNSGIEYILIIPYLLLGAFVLIVLKGKMKPFWKDLTGKDKGKQQDFTAENWY